MSNEYLTQLLREQSLDSSSTEVIEMEKQRSEIEDHLHAEFASSTITLVPAGSWAKDTMVRPRYDIDLICYFDADDTSAGNSIEEIYDKVGEKIKGSYRIKRCTSVIRILTPKDDWTHIDVVPGRYVDESRSDAWICLSDDKEKDRRRTNLATHVSTVRDSGYTGIIKLAKLWRETYGFKVRTFVLELLVLEVMKNVSGTDTDGQFAGFLKEIFENIGNYTIEDPANPSGNPLTEYFNDAIKDTLAQSAGAALSDREMGGWEKVFEPLHAKELVSSGSNIFIPGDSMIRVKPWLQS